MKKYQSTADTALSLANHNQQYSQKNNIKFIGWKENAKENLREDLCAILKAAGVTTDPTDILAIHRIPAGSKDGKLTPVIAKFKDTDTNIRIIRNRSKEIVKKHFIIFDHITPMNAKLLRDLNGDQRIDSALYYNDKIFATDRQGIRQKIDILAMWTRSWDEFHKRGAKFDQTREPKQLTVLRSGSLDVKELSCVKCCVKVCMCFCCMVSGYLQVIYMYYSICIIFYKRNYHAVVWQYQNSYDKLPRASNSFLTPRCF